MNELEKIREEINEIDFEIIKLFKKRFNCIEKVLSYKKENGLPVFDESREKELLEKNKALLNNNALWMYYEEWFKAMLKVSKDYQKYLLSEE